MYQLKVNLQQSIRTLHKQGWSKRRIARKLSFHDPFLSLS